MRPVVQATDIRALNAVTLSPNGVIVAVLTGFQDEQASLKLREDILKVIQKQRKHHRKAIIMLDVSRTTDHSREAEAVYASFIASDAYDAMAAYGVGELKYQFVLDLAKQHGRSDRFRPFANELEAARWLATYLVKEAKPKKRKLLRR